jgi:ATP-dependent Clp protease ATP-binding subunit ClpB
MREAIEGDVEDGPCMGSEGCRLSGLGPFLFRHIRGQEHAVERVTHALVRGELGLTDVRRPRGSFLFLGPTGVGKTELALRFSEYLFGADTLFRFDMSEFMHFDSVKEFRGDESGGEGRLGAVLSRHDHGTILFDEVEKAHPRILDLFLQILDTARITLGSGMPRSVSGFYLVFTSNIGSQKVMHARHSVMATLEKAVIRELARHFRPEFCARFQEKIVFHRLTHEVQIEIARLSLERELGRLRSVKGLAVGYESDVLDFLARDGIDVRNGARPLRNAIERHVQGAVADAILSGRIGDGTLRFDAIRQKAYLEPSCGLGERKV